MITKFPCYQTKLIPPMAKAKDALEDRCKWLHSSHVQLLQIRVLEAETIADGWGFKFIESYRLNDQKRQYRVMVMDVFGDIRYMSPDYATAATARAKFAEEVEMVDWMKKAIQTKRKQLNNQLAKLAEWEAIL